MSHGHELCMLPEVSRFAFRGWVVFPLSCGLFALVNEWSLMRATSGQEERGLDDSRYGEHVNWREGTQNAKLTRSPPVNQGPVLPL